MNNNRKPVVAEKKGCLFCQAGVREVDFKDTASLSKFISSFKKILPRRRTGACATHQRKLSRAIKLAREMSLLPAQFIRTQQ